jgi:Flp pilus assembly protein TadD
MGETTQPAATAETPEQALARAQTAGRAKRMHEAMGICHDVLLAAPDHAPALALLGTLQAQDHKLEEGIALLERAVARDASVPGWHANLCALYRLAGRPADALRAGLAAVKLNAGVPQFLVNLALAQIDLDQREPATACLLRAIGIAPEDASAHLALGQVLLAGGQMQPGWIEYEWRNKTEAARGTMPRITSAHWNGMRLKGGRILLVGDQGYGDTIQFARYIPMVADRCDEVILGCSAELAPLLAGLPGVGRCHSNWAEVPGHAAHCRLSSLPWIFGTELDTIPGPHPYLHPEPAKVADWAARLGPREDGRLRVGLAWSGRPTHPNDRRRSIRLAQLLPLARAAPEARFVCLQKPVPEADREALAQFPGMTDLSASLTDFADTAALVANLDLLITVDTGVGHLAGAIGTPAWLLLSRASDWRWLLDRDDTPWYPRTRLFRQAYPGAWEATIEAAAAALATVSAEAPQLADA